MRRTALAEPVKVAMRDIVACDIEVFRNWQAVLSIMTGFCEMLRRGSGLVWTSTPDGFRELRKPIDEERFQDWVAALSGKS